MMPSIYLPMTFQSSLCAMADQIKFNISSWALLLWNYALFPCTFTLKSSLLRCTASLAKLQTSNYKFNSVLKAPLVNAKSCKGIVRCELCYVFGSKQECPETIWYSTVGVREKSSDLAEAGGIEETHNFTSEYKERQQFLSFFPFLICPKLC